MTELETTISLVLGSWASTPLKQLHHRLVISSQRAVDLVLMILFQAPHFSVQAAPCKGPKSGWKLLSTTSQDLILLGHMIVYLYLLGRHQHNWIQSAAVWILIMFMAFLLLMTRIPLALGRQGLHQKVKLPGEDLTIGVLFSLVIILPYVHYLCLQAFRDLPLVRWSGCLSFYLEPPLCNVFFVFNPVHSLFLTFSLGRGAGLCPTQQSHLLS